MSNTLHLNLSDNTDVERICRAAFPEYRGKRVQVRYNAQDMNLRSYWDGGSKSYWRVIDITAAHILAIPTTHPMFDRNVKGIECFTPPAGFVVVEHCYFSGKDMGLRVYVPGPAPLLPAGDDTAALSEHETLVLLATATRKSSYAGIKDYRASELMSRYLLTMQDITAARASLHAKGMMKSNAITNAGRNAIENHPKRMSF